MAMFLLRGLPPLPAEVSQATNTSFALFVLTQLSDVRLKPSPPTVKCDNMLHCMLFAGVRERVKAREERERERDREKERERERGRERGERRETRCRESFVTPKSFVATKQPNWRSSARGVIQMGKSNNQNKILVQ